MKNQLKKGINLKISQELLLIFFINTILLTKIFRFYLEKCQQMHFTFPVK